MAVKHEFSYRTIINAVPATVYFTYSLDKVANGSLTNYKYRYYNLTVDYQQDRVIADNESSHTRTLKYSAEYAQGSAKTIDYAGFSVHDFETLQSTTNIKCTIPNNTERNTIYTATLKTGDFTYMASCIIRHRLYNTGSGTVGYDPNTTTDYVTEYMSMPPVRDNYKLTAADHITDDEAPRFSFKSPYNTTAAPSALGIANYIRLAIDGVTPIVSREIFLQGESTATAEIVLTEDERKALRRGVTEGKQAPLTYILDSVWNPTIYSDSGHPSIGTSEYVYTSDLTASITLVNADPVISSIYLADIDAITTALTGDNGTIIRYCSDVQYTCISEGQKEADIASITAENAGAKSAGSAGTIANVEGSAFVFTVTDSRGNTTTKTVTMPMVDYIKPTCSIVSGQISSAGICELSAKGNYFNDSFGAEFNDIVVQCRYKLKGGEYGAWHEMSVTIDNYTYSATTTIEGLDYRQQYIFQVQVIDLLSEATTPDTSFISKPLFSWGKDDFLFETDVHIKGNLRLKGEGNYGNKINFGDGDYTYIEEETDDKLKIKATGISFNTSTIDLNGNSYINGYALPYTGIQSGTWVPTLTTSAAVSSYTNQYGWWMRIGEVVTIGFNVKAEIKSGYNSTLLYISGVPYTPQYDAFGGGVAYNIYVGAGLNFESWAINTEGTIGVRLQPCNNTSATNLNIASSAYYPSGGGSVTLAGTICFTL